MSQPLNVLFIVADQFRADCLHAAGNPVIQTPNLDALAAEGTLFTHCFVQSAPCGPSRASFLTSRYLCSHRSVDNMTPLMDAAENLAVQLRRHGYLPVLLGYNDYAIDPRLLPADDPRACGLDCANFLPGWHMPFYHEFDSPEYYAWLRARGYPESLLNREALYSPVLPPEGPGDHLPLRYPAPYRAEDSDTRFLVDKTLERIQRMRGRGWFVNVNFLKPHPPRIAPAPYNDMYDPAEMPPPARDPRELDDPHPYYRFMRRELCLESERDWRETRAVYYGMISELDASLGRLFRRLKEAGEWDRTLIVFTSDHGEYLGDHYLLEKGHFYDAAMRVPLIIRDPSPEADATRGRQLDGFCESVDWAPTMLEFLGIPIPDRFQGQSFLPALRGGGDRALKDAIHYEYDFRNAFPAEGEPDPDRRLLWVHRDQAFKYVQFASEALPPLLFDIRADPGEFTNLADRPDCASVALRCCQALLRWRMKHEDQRMEQWAAAYRISEK
jgi:arylsulfatase A-like enzyme